VTQALGPSSAVEADSCSGARECHSSGETKPPRSWEGKPSASVRLAFEASSGVAGSDSFRRGRGGSVAEVRDQ